MGALTDFSSLTEPVMRTIQIEQVEGWRKAISAKMNPDGMPPIDLPQDDLKALIAYVENLK